MRNSADLPNSSRVLQITWPKSEICLNQPGNLTCWQSIPGRAMPRLSPPALHWSAVTPFHHIITPLHRPRCQVQQGDTKKNIQAANCKCPSCAVTTSLCSLHCRDPSSSELHPATRGGEFSRQGQAMTLLSSLEEPGLDVGAVLFTHREEREGEPFFRLRLHCHKRRGFTRRWGYVELRTPGPRLHQGELA